MKSILFVIFLVSCGSVLASHVDLYPFHTLKKQQQLYQQQQQLLTASVLLEIILKLIFLFLLKQ